MQGPGPSLQSPAVVGPQRGPVLCFVGTVNLFEFTQPPLPGSVIGELVTSVGVAVPLTQSSPSTFGGHTLASVNRTTATLCGPLVFQNGQLALDIVFVSPGTSASTPGVSPLALLVLSLLGLLPAAG